MIEVLQPDVETYSTPSLPGTPDRGAWVRWVGGGLLLVASLGLAALVAFSTQPMPAAPVPEEAPRDALAASRQVQAEFRTRLGLLASLAAVPALDQPQARLRELDRHARATADLLGTRVAIADVGLATLVDTGEPFGTLLPGLGAAPGAIAALETGRPVVVEATEEPGLPVQIAVPVLRQERVIAAITAPVGRETLERALDTAARLPIAVALLSPADRVVASGGLAGAPWADLRRVLAQGRTSLVAADGGSWTTAGHSLEEVPGWLVLVATPSMAAAPTLLPEWQSLAAGGLVALMLVGVIAVMRRRRGVMPGEAAALHSLAEMRRLNDTIPVGLALLDRDMRFVSINARFASITGLPPAEHLRRQPREVLPPGIAETLADACRIVIETGQPAIDLPIRAEAPGEIRNERHFLASCHPALDGAQRVTGVSIVMQDVTDRVRAETARELLVRELNHRVKNTLATVQSIVASTLRQAGDSPARIGTTLSARLQALARAHDLLTAREWQSADLAEVVQAALAPWLQGTPQRILIDGPIGVSLRPGQAQAVVLAMHELATNAVKYGALSVPEGRVGLIWEAEPGEPVRLRWIESGGPLVTEPAPTRRGFGTRMLERALAADLGSGSTVRLHFAPQGLRALVTFGGPPGAALKAAETDLARLRRGDPPVTSPRRVAAG